MLGNPAVIGIFLLLTIVFPIGAIVTAWLFRPHYKSKNKQTDEKYDAYECGVDTQGRTWTRVRINYFLYALVFLAFDVETIFLFPWALEFQKLGIFAFGEMVVFIFILVLGLIYAWKEEALEWH
jgi:NADH-quinone oxidoreductase subunit A